MMQDEEEVLIRDDSGLLHGESSTSRPWASNWKRKIFKTLALSSTFCVLGLCNAIPGPTLMDLGERVNADIGPMTLVFAARSIGYLLGSVLGGLLFDRFDKQILLFCTLLISSVATIAIPWSQTLVILSVLISFQGLTMGILDTGSNLFCIRIWGRKSAPYMQFLHFAFGIGAFIAPLLATPFISGGNFISSKGNYSIKTNNDLLTKFLNETIHRGERSVNSKHHLTIDLDQGRHSWLNEARYIREAGPGNASAVSTTNSILNVTGSASTIPALLNMTQNAMSNMTLTSTQIAGIPINGSTPKSQPETSTAAVVKKPEKTGDEPLNTFKEDTTNPNKNREAENVLTTPANPVLLGATTSVFTNTSKAPKNDSTRTLDSTTKTDVPVKSPVSGGNNTQDNLISTNTSPSDNQSPATEPTTPSPPATTSPTKTPSPTTTTTSSPTETPPPAKTTTTPLPKPSTPSTEQPSSPPVKTTALPTTTPKPSTTTATTTTPKPSTTLAPTSTSTKSPSTTTLHKVSPTAKQTSVKPEQPVNPEQPPSTPQSTPSSTANTTRSANRNVVETVDLSTTISPSVTKPNRTIIEEAISAVKNMSKVQFAYLIIGLALLGNSILFLVLYCKDKGQLAFTDEDQQEAGVKNDGACFKGTILGLLFIFFFCYIGAEVTFGGLITTFAVEFNHWSKDTGAILAAVFWGSLAAGRGFAIFISKCCGPTVMISIDIFFMILGGLVLTIGLYFYLNLLWLGTLLLGLGMSSVFPAAMSWTENYFRVTGKSTAVFVFSSALGQMVIPVMTGYLFQIRDGMVLMQVTLGLSIINLVIFVSLQCFVKRKGKLFVVRDRNGFLPLDEEDNMELETVHYDKSQERVRTTNRRHRTKEETDYKLLISDLDDD